MANKKRFLSGVKPTGRPHIGNYFGAMKQFVDLLNTGDYDSFVFVADYHGLNFIQNAQEMRGLIIDLVKDYIAIGLDPQRVTLFKQSDISEHTELCWIFDTITSISYLARAHAFKAAVEKYTDAQPAQRALSSKLEQLTEVNVGTFNYPVLMAADILLYDADIVPVGQDQKQHIEYSRDIAQKFNNTFGETFKLPEDLIQNEVSTVPGTDGRKMSKSYGNTIPLFGTKDETIKAVMSIVTDSSGQVPQNVYAIHKLFRPDTGELDAVYEKLRGNYKVLKEVLIDDIEAIVAPMRAKRDSITDEEIKKVLTEGGEKARTMASAKMKVVREKIGVTI